MYKRFEAETLKGALLKVKQELGPDAQILNHRQVRRSGIPGIMGQKVWQVIAMKPVAASDEKPKSPAGQGWPSAERDRDVQRSAAPRPAPQKWKVQQPINHLIDEPALPFAELSREPKAVPAYKSPGAQPHRPSPSLPSQSLEKTALRVVLKEMRALSEKLETLNKPSAEHVILPGVLPGVHQKLISQEVPRDLALDLMNELIDRPALDLNDEPKILEVLEELLAQQIHTVAFDSLFSSRRPRIIFVVGPAGVGKTTTLAKMGMLSARDEKLKVAFVTLDTFRVAAAEQLKTYADLLPADIEVVLSEEELTSAVVRHADKDMILVDTPGKNPCSAAALSDFGAYLKRLAAAKLPAPAVLLVLSASTKQSDLMRYARCYQSLDPAAIVFSKIDETSSYGALIPVLHESRLPMVFMTTGQDMPDDIEPANNLRLARKILGNRNAA